MSDSPIWLGRKPIKWEVKWAASMNESLARKPIERQITWLENEMAIHTDMLARTKDKKLRPRYRFQMLWCATRLEEIKKRGLR